MSRLNKKLTHFLKKGWIVLAILVIALAILFSVFRALTPWATQYKSEIETHLSTLVGQPVKIQSVETSWYWFKPVLKLNEVSVSDAQDHVLKLNKLLVGINLFGSLWHRQIQPGILYIDDVHLSLRQVDTRWQIDGLSNDQELTFDLATYRPILNWLLAQQKIILRNISATLHLANGTTIPLDSLNLTVANHSGRYRFKGALKLAQAIPTRLALLADLYIDPFNLEKTRGEAYVALMDILPAQWQEFLPASSYVLQSGQGNIELWLDIAQGRISNLQALTQLDHIAWSQYGRAKSYFIPYLKANLAWNPTKAGWQLSGDQIRLKMAGIRWPENKILVEYDATQNAHLLYVKNLLLAPLLAADFDWPEVLSPVIALHPYGELYNTQLLLKDGQPNYLITRFFNLGWHGNEDIPAVNRLSGVMQWQPEEGHLELDAEDTIVKPYNLPPVSFKEINGAIDWKELSHGLRLSVDRLVITRPDLILSARGIWDNPLSPDGYLALSAEYSAEQAQKWLLYLPRRGLKPKLHAWLKENIKYIDKASGRLRLDGRVKDFPYDKQPGEFFINNHLTGMQLLFTDKWPLTTEVDAYLRFEKRTLAADVLQANLHGVAVDNVNLRIDELGSDHETLLIHGNTKAEGEQVMSYVLISPLRERLAKLKMLSITGILGVDLRLEIPLYPENDEVLAKGMLTFADNAAILHHALRDIEFNNITGNLMFDEHGVSNSALQAVLLGDPITMHIQSVRGLKPYTEVRMAGKTTIDLLKNKLNLPIFSLLHGNLEIESALTITDDPNDLDHVQIKTPLQGVAIDLPEPLGKTSADVAPLLIDVDFNPAKALRVCVNYDNRLSADLWFSKAKNSFVLDKGAIHLGRGKAAEAKEKGVAVTGALPSFKLAPWQDVLRKLPAEDGSLSMRGKIRLVQLNIGSLKLLDHEYRNLAINARKTAPQEWAIHLNQQDLIATLDYKPQENLLTGHFQHLYLDKSLFAGKKSSSWGKAINPKDIPNLNVLIDDLRVGGRNLGQVMFKSTTKNNVWQLEDCKINSPAYKLILKGNWKKDKSQNVTSMQANLQISNLAKSLRQWNIPPVVEAHSGNVQFTGGWQGSLFDFSLAKLTGDLYIILKNGRITNLGPETEEKLGLGKLLSILSLQTIPRRLKLDFSDLTHEGYSFDVFKGSFVLKHGVMRTADSYIDGPVAYAAMKGDLDLDRQLYDLDLQVSPHITASLPVVATIAGGPLAGIATWVASKIINQGMQKINSYTYKVTGAWLDPVVQQVSIE
ncbi:YhdP family protein [Legionella septentrionalis]|uniref:YhdP family protein n=1 Tax=Legionella septentrionalis TaxID=2498109 RepID=UPI000F8CFF32|nr:YhdP family protein [Legionella septentrionalis]RUR11792.1 TIGR02099 family protein [Legionella septentrionalis]